MEFTSHLRSEGVGLGNVLGEEVGPVWHGLNGHADVAERGWELVFHVYEYETAGAGQYEEEKKNKRKKTPYRALFRKFARVVYTRKHRLI